MWRRVNVNFSNNTRIGSVVERCGRSIRFNLSLMEIIIRVKKSPSMIFRGINCAVISVIGIFRRVGILISVGESVHP